MDGLAATTKIRQKEMNGEGPVGKTVQTGPRAGSRLPIVVVTANVRKEQIDTAIAAGAVCGAHRLVDLANATCRIVSCRSPSRLLIWS